SYDEGQQHGDERQSEFHTNPGYMQDAFNPIEFLDYLRGRWRVMVSACAIAVALAAAGSLMLPKSYTANAVIVIEPPGNDPRAATVVSPVYLESLKTYERFALSDSLF